nr:ATP-binding protein [Ktedonosporobacter rubrisoli]
MDVELSLERNELCLTITDDGQGFDPLALRSHKKGGGFGLIGMQERLKMLQGRLETISTPGVGTQIVAMIPLKDEVLSHKFAYNGGGTT